MNIQLKTFTMKTKITLLIAFVGISFTSCIKDYYGEGESSNQIEFTSENYLYEGNLEKQFLEEKITSIDAEIDLLQETSPNSPDYNDDQARIAELQEERSNSKQRISIIFDLGLVGIDIPIPCDQPNGKCIPKRLEYLIIPSTFIQTAFIVRNETGETIGFSERLVDLPGFEKDLKYLRIPVVENFDQQISIEIIKKDNLGEQIRYTVILSE